jgi:hypothetical protein
LQPLADVAALLFDAGAFGCDRIELAQFGERQRGALRGEPGVFVLQRAQPVDRRGRSPTRTIRNASRAAAADADAARRLRAGGARRVRV